MYTSALIFKKGMDSIVKQQLKALFFSLHETETGRNILRKTLISKYEPADSSDFNRVSRFLKEFKRKMKN
jgi:ABC-type phosphate/phosphonate transport system substrate-binding protein